jgi:polyisoprenoid-binding protein YceI
MSRTTAAVLIVIAFAVGAAVGAGGLLYSTGRLTDSRDAAEVAPTLSLDMPTDVPAVDNELATSVADANAKLDLLTTEIAVINGELTDLNADVGAIAAMPTAIPATNTPEVTPTLTPTPTPALPERALFRIDEDESEARFKIDETLFGNAIVVVGTTRRVGGDIIVNYQSPAESQIGTIAINVRTLRTDNEFRDQAIRGQILEANNDDFEFVTFTPTEILSLEETVAVGDSVTFEVLGDLTIKGVTQQVTFEVTITADSLEQITGFAVTEIAYADYGINIEAPPSVSGIGDIVTLELDFVATVVDSE